jgi:ferric-dicitrate binding protein FerR (iron transport regulator)
MKEDHLVSMIVMHWSGELDAAGVYELEEWASQDPANRRLLDQVSDEVELRQEISRWKQIDPAKGYTKWLAEWKDLKRGRIVRIVGWTVAASLLGIVIIRGLLMQAQGPVMPADATSKEKQVTILPGRYTATLTLADGRQILLDSAENGQLTMQGNTRLLKEGSHILSYEQRGADIVTERYNILTTPRSGQYQLTLPDGSLVWLNNVSSLRYPTSFQAKERVVELTGEAYFEVAKDLNKPFIVKTKDGSIEVLGTNFNIMAYTEEGGTQTTLLNGRVRVNTGRAMAELAPDEQAKVEQNGELIVLKGVPSADIVSWKSGFFYFGRTAFASMMRQLARWYDVDIIYQGKAPDVEFSGKIDRSLPLNEVLEFLDKNQIHFRIEGRKLIVLPS